MSQEIQIPKHYVPTFKRQLIMALQQRGSRLRPYLSHDMAAGEGSSPVDLFGETEAEEKTERNGDTPIMDVDRARRWVFPREFHWGTLIDNADKLKQMVDPTSNLTQAALWALGRKLDREIIIPSFFGKAFEGKDVSTAVGGAVAFDTSLYQIDIQTGTSPAADTGMNVAKLQAVKKRFMELEVDLDMEKVHIGIGPTQWSDLFDDAKAINGDFINGRPLSTGDLPGLFDVVFVNSNYFPKTGTTRSCPAWVPSGMMLMDWENPMVEADKDPGKQYAVRPYAKFMAGATRTQEGRVLEIPCKE